MQERQRFQALSYQAQPVDLFQRLLPFSSIVDLISLVVFGIYPSVNPAYRAQASSLNVSRTAVCGKLNGIYLVLVLRRYEKLPHL
jgi:hypothetical protein